MTWDRNALGVSQDRAAERHGDNHRKGGGDEVQLALVDLPYGAANTVLVGMGASLPPAYSATPQVTSVAIGGATFTLSLSGGNPRVTFDTNDYLEYTRSSNTLNLTIGSTAVMRATAAALKHLGYASFIGVLTDPANTTAGDLTAKRGHFGTDGAFTANVELEVTGDFHVSGEITGKAWTAMVFNAANYTANAGATWGVQLADQVTYAYDLIRKTATVALELGATSITVATPTVLSIAIPFTAAKAMATLCYLIDNAVVAVGLMQVAAGGTAITVSRLDGAAFALSANLTFVQGTFTFEVQ